METVYKVCVKLETPKQGRPIFDMFASITNGDLRLQYMVGKQTIPVVGKLFAFLHIDASRNWRLTNSTSSRGQLVILKGECSKIVVPPGKGAALCLTICDLEDDKAGTFWSEYLSGQLEANTGELPCVEYSYFQTPPGTVLVDDFTES